MTSSNDSRVEVALLQKEIAQHLGMASENLLFEYRNSDGKTRLDLITVNPRHSQSFLFHTVVGVNQMEALQKMADYVKTARTSENSYTVQWMAMNDRELHTSYFRAKNIYEALDKLYYGRDSNTMTVYTVQLNPIS